jgi:hypothetical protein
MVKVDRKAAQPHLSIIKFELFCPALFIVDACFPEKDAMSYPVACSRLRPFENEKARNEHRVWPGAGSAEAIEKFLAEYYCFSVLLFFNAQRPFS